MYILDYIGAIVCHLKCWFWMIYLFLVKFAHPGADIQGSAPGTTLGQVSGKFPRVEVALSGTGCCKGWAVLLCCSLRWAQHNQLHTLAIDQQVAICTLSAVDTNISRMAHTSPINSISMHACQAKIYICFTCLRVVHVEKWGQSCCNLLDSSWFHFRRRRTETSHDLRKFQLNPRLAWCHVDLQVIATHEQTAVRWTWTNSGIRTPWQLDDLHPRFFKSSQTGQENLFFGVQKEGEIPEQSWQSSKKMMKHI